MLNRDARDQNGSDQHFLIGKEVHARNQNGMLMDLMSPLLPSAFVFIVCLGSLSRSFTGVASGATRAALPSISRFKIMQQIYLPSKLQGCSMSFLNTLNGERSSLLVQHFMKTGQVLSAEKVSSEEHVLPLWLNPWSSKVFRNLHERIRLGVNVSSLDHMDMTDLYRFAGSHYKKARYLLLEKKGIINIVMHKDSTPADTLQSYMHALVMANLMAKSTAVHLESWSWMDKHYEDFLKKLGGWETGRLMSHSVVWRASWLIESSDEKIN